MTKEAMFAIAGNDDVDSIMVELKDWMNKCDERSSDQQKRQKKLKKHGSPFIVLLEESVCLLILE
jgi:hypothetical protein